MATLQVIGEDGTIQEREVISRNALVDTEQEQFRPEVVQRVEYDHSGQSSSVTTVCGETENRRESDEKPAIAVEGVITEDQIEDAKALKNRDEATLVSDVHQGPVFVKRLTIEQNADVVSYRDESGEQLAFAFQLQLKQPE